MAHSIAQKIVFVVDILEKKYYTLDDDNKEEL